MRPLGDLRVAVGFLTRVSVGDVTGGGQRTIRLGDAVPWFPLVGAGVGLAMGGVWRGMVEVVPPLVAATLAVIAGLLLTGAFHHDGLADIADAFGGGWDVEQRFEILKDSRLGTYGTSALVAAILLEVTTLASFAPDDGLRALVAAHALGRAAALGVMVTAPLAADGLGATYVQELRRPMVGLGIAVGITIAALTSPVLVVWPVLAAVVVALAVVGLAVRKIGGQTGDVLGAVAVCSGLAAFVAIV